MRREIEVHFGVRLADIENGATELDTQPIEQWFEAASKVYGPQNAEQMLADVLFMGNGTFGGTALHLSASYGHDLIAAQLLAENPGLIHVQNKAGSLALHFAAQAGHNEIVAMLIAKAPHLTTAENDAGDTAFHVAASSGHGTVLAQLLAANSGLANVGINQRCWNVLHCAVSSGEEAVVEMVLAVDPTLIHATSEGVVWPLEQTVFRSLAAIGRPFVAYDKLQFGVPF